MGKDSGPSAGDIASQQLDLQKQLAGLSFANAQSGQQLLAPAAGYWQALLNGGQDARVAVGPTAELIGQNSDATRRSIMQSMPAGGQRDRALLDSRIGQQGQVARLYSGVQPMAAEHLTQLAGIPYGVSTSFAGSSSPNIGASLSAFEQGANRDSATASSAGRLLYQGMNKNGSSSGGGKSGGGYGSGAQGKSGVFA